MRFRFAVQRQLGCFVYPFPFSFGLVEDGADQGEIAVFGTVAAGHGFYCLHDETAVETAQFPAAQGGQMAQAVYIRLDALFTPFLLQPFDCGFVPSPFGLGTQPRLLPKFVF